VRWMTDSAPGRGIEARVVEPTTTLDVALEALLGSRVGVVAVVDGSGALLGTVDLRTIMGAVESVHRTPDADRDAATDEVAAR
jgi:osmoprotectant transport system ATP-binding protein